MKRGESRKWYAYGDKDAVSLKSKALVQLRDPVLARRLAEAAVVDGLALYATASKAKMRPKLQRLSPSRYIVNIYTEVSDASNVDSWLRRCVAPMAESVRADPRWEATPVRTMEEHNDPMAGVSVVKLPKRRT